MNIALQPRRVAASHSPPATLECRLKNRVPLTTFRMNTCKSMSKQTTLSIFRMNTYAKPRGRGAHLTKRQHGRNVMIFAGWSV